MANCKLGDLCIIKIPKEHHNSKHNDKFVTVIEACDDYSFSNPIGWIIDRTDLDCHCGCRSYIERIADSHLRPIRDNPGEDETLQWAPMPQKELTNA